MMLKSKLKVWVRLNAESDMHGERFANLVAARMLESSKPLSRRSLGFFALMAVFAPPNKTHCTCVKCGHKANFFTEMQRKTWPGNGRMATRNTLEWNHIAPRNGNRTQVITRMKLDDAFDALARGECELLCIECHQEVTSAQRARRKEQRKIARRRGRKHQPEKFD